LRRAGGQGWLLQEGGLLVRCGNQPLGRPNGSEEGGCACVYESYTTQQSEGGRASFCCRWQRSHKEERDKKQLTAWVGWVAPAECGRAPSLSQPLAAGHDVNYDKGEEAGAQGQAQQHGHVLGHTQAVVRLRGSGQGGAAVMMAASLLAAKRAVRTTTCWQQNKAVGAVLAWRALLA
jgi:hypothetical protein